MARMQSEQDKVRLLDAKDSTESMPIDAVDPQQEDRSGDAAVGAAITKAGSSAVGVAKDAGRSFAGGISALKEVRRVTKLRTDAQADLREIERGLAEDQDLLAHREEVERNYSQIVATQTAEIEDATAEVEETAKAIRKQQDKQQHLEADLRQMRAQHEQKLRPYRNLMDSSRGRSDDAAKALANAKRSVRSAEAALNDATKRRDQRISAAHRAVDNAKERMSTVQHELDVLNADEASSPTALAKVEGELATEASHLQMAVADVDQITKESQSAVDQAQKNLWTLQRELSAAEKAAETAKEEATARKDEYDGLYRDAQAKERALEEAIKSCEARKNSLVKSHDSAQARAQGAQDILDEANEIHAHPETTEGLRQRIADEEADLLDAQAELDELSVTERELRRSTRGSRAIVIVTAVAVIALIVVLVWFLTHQQ